MNFFNSFSYLKNPVIYYFSNLSQKNNLSDQQDNASFKSFVFVIFFIFAAATGVFLFAHERTSQTFSIIEGDGTNGPKNMVLIPGGEFTMGSNSRLARDNEKPAHQVYY